MALFLPSAILVGETRLMTFALVPQCFMALRMRWAITRSPSSMSCRSPAGRCCGGRATRTSSSTAVSAVVTLVFSVAVGSWIIRIIEQSQERAELIAELDASRHEISRLSAAHGALAERERMAREIHDTLAQGFTSLLMLIQAVEAELDARRAAGPPPLALMDETARQNLAEARALVAGGTPADLDGASLPDALRRLAARHEATLDVTGPVRALPAGPEVVALRACQEALANARKHAGSPARGRHRAGLRRRPRSPCPYGTTGCGFDPGAAPRGYGLAGLRARAAEVGGTAQVRSAPGDGTTVTVEPARTVPRRRTPQGVPVIRIILADDHPVVREGLRAMLSAEPDLDVVAEAASGPQAEALAAELRPDIVLMDLRMPGGGGVDSIVRMTRGGAAVPGDRPDDVRDGPGHPARRRGGRGGLSAQGSAPW